MINLIVLLMAVYVSAYGWWCSIHTNEKDGENVLQFSILFYNHYKVFNGGTKTDIGNYVLTSELRDADCIRLWKSKDI